MLIARGRLSDSSFYPTTQSGKFDQEREDFWSQFSKGEI
jgi:hypothetical protein